MRPSHEPLLSRKGGQDKIKALSEEIVVLWVLGLTLLLLGFP
jgi:hypothetical protein